MRKVLLLVLFTAIAVSCGDDVQVFNQYSQLSSSDFEGFYECENGSRVELIADFADRITFETIGQSFNSVNPENGTLGTHPVIADRDVLILGNQLMLAPRDYNYTDGNDIEEDNSGSNIRGRRRTDIKVSLLTERDLQVSFQIYDNRSNDNINGIAASRTFNCLRQL